MNYSNLELASPQLKKIIQSFENRLEMNDLDKDLFRRILGFTFFEGMSKGKEELINDEIKPESHVEKE